MFVPAIDALLTLEAVQASVTIGGHTVSAVCSGIEKVWADSDYGAIRNAEGIQVYYKTEPAEWNGDKAVGKRAEVLFNGVTHKMRVLGRNEQGGIYRMTLSTEGAER